MPVTVLDDETAAVNAGDVIDGDKSGGVSVCVAEGLPVEASDGVAVLEPLPLPVMVGDPLGVRLGVTVGVFEGVSDNNGNAEVAAVGDTDTVAV